MHDSISRLTLANPGHNAARHYAPRSECPLTLYVALGKTLYVYENVVVYEMHVSNIHSVVTHRGILSVLLLILGAL